MFMSLWPRFLGPPCMCVAAQLGFCLPMFIRALLLCLVSESREWEDVVPCDRRARRAYAAVYALQAGRLTFFVDDIRWSPAFGAVRYTGLVKK